MGEIKVSQDAMDQTGAQTLANPPKFPLLKGEEEEQIVVLLTRLTGSGVIKWFKFFVNPTAWFYIADYKGMRFKLCDLFDRNTIIITSLNVFLQDTQNGKSFISTKVEDLKTAIENQNPPSEDFVKYVTKKLGGKTFLELVWDTLNS